MNKNTLFGQSPLGIVKPINPGGNPQLFWVVGKANENPFADGVILFDQASAAILWALVSGLDVVPIAGPPNDQDHVEGIIRDDEDLPPRTYPAPGVYVLYEFQLIQSFPFYAALNDEQLESDQAKKLAAASPRNMARGSPLIYSNFIERKADGSFLFNRTMARIANILEIFRPEEARILSELGEILLNPNGTLNIQEYALVNTSEILGEVKIVAGVAQIAAFKFSNPDVLKLKQIEFINWEAAWLQFIRVRNEIDLHQLPPQWDYYIGSIKNTDIDSYEIGGILINPSKGSTINPSNVPTNQTSRPAVNISLPSVRKNKMNKVEVVQVNDQDNDGLCIANIKGFSNPTDFCFMDSTLIAMFLFLNSPFTENMLIKDLPQNIPPFCDDNPEQDYNLRYNIQQTLRDDYNRLLSGTGSYVCSRLRTLLGRDCRLTFGGEPLGEDMSLGVHDPNELYERLMGALAYAPITYRSTTEFASNTEGEDIELAQNNLVTSTLLPPMNTSSGLVSWPDSWQQSFEQTERRGARTFKRDRLNIISADVIVFALTRGVRGIQQSGKNNRIVNVTQPVQKINAPPIDIFAGLSTKPLPNPSIPLPSVPLPLPSQPLPTQPLPTANKPQSLAELAASFGVGPTAPANTLQKLTALPRPTAPHQQRSGRAQQLEVDTTEVLISHQFIVNGIPYNLRAVVYSVFTGHFGTLINCGGEWVGYNDKTTKNYIAQNRIDTSNVEQLINTRGVLFFYYPDLSPDAVEERKMIEARVRDQDEQEDVFRQVAMVEAKERNQQEELERQNNPQPEVIPPIQINNSPQRSPGGTSDDEIARAIAMSLMDQNSNSPAFPLSNSSPFSTGSNNSVRSNSPLGSPQSPRFQSSISRSPTQQVQQDFLERWTKAQILVIGANYSQEDYNKWSDIDPNYIGVGLVNQFANDQVVKFTNANPFGGVWGEDPVWDYVLALAERTGKKFNTVWLDPRAWGLLGARSKMGGQIILTVWQIVRNVGVNTQKQWIGTFNVPIELNEQILSQTGSPIPGQVVPLWEILTDIGPFQAVSDDPIVSYTDDNGVTIDFAMLVPIRPQEQSPPRSPQQSPPDQGRNAPTLILRGQRQ